MDGRLVAIALGVLQGIFEWLPISSEGNLTLLLTAMGESPAVATKLSLFLHLGTALAATAYYRDDLWDIAVVIPEWRPATAFEAPTVTASFLALATLASGVVGAAAFALLDRLATVLTGGAFIALIGVLLVATGVLQRVAAAGIVDPERTPTPVDALLVGGFQGLAILPGISRSGTTTGVLLLRGYDGERAFRLSFLLSIPAAIGGGLVAVVAAGGLPGISPVEGLLALASAALVGYLTIDVLMRIVRRVAFWGICLGLGGLAVLGGVVVALG